MSKSNPWRRDMLPREHGRAVIHASPDAGPVRFKREYLVQLVRRQVPAGSIVFQVGIYRGARERSAQVVLLNGGNRDVLPWRAFSALVHRIAASLCVDLAQHAVMLELQPARGDYRVRTFEQDPRKVARQRAALVRLTRTRR